jgi:hypothetical protein
MTEVRGKNIRVDGRLVKGNRLRVFLVCQSEDGSQVEVPVSEGGKVIITATEVDAIHHTGGSLEVKAKRIASVATAKPEQLRVDCLHLDHLVAESVRLSAVRIQHCYAGCRGAHQVERPVCIRKEKRNPFDSPERAPFTPRLRETLRTIVLPRENT